jgi:hypothetical protein
MLKEKPILFSSDMVRAILAGRKFMTRRSIGVDGRKYYFQTLVQHATGRITFAPQGKYPIIDSDIIEKKCRIEKSDILYVREAFAPWCGVIQYKADNPAEKKGQPLKFKPSIHLPKKDSRIWLEVTDVRVELLHDISESDARSEGVELHERGVKWLNYQDREAHVTQFIFNCDTAKKSFLTLWGMINDCNPYCVMSFGTVPFDKLEIFFDRVQAYPGINSCYQRTAWP